MIILIINININITNIKIVLIMQIMLIIINLLSGSGHAREGRQVMRRNNDWLAVLAVSLVLSILRNGLAGERYPLDYDNAELPVNRSKSAYETYHPNELTSSNSNPSTSSPIAESRSSSFAAPQSTQSRVSSRDKNVVPSKHRPANPTNVITQRRATKLNKLEDEKQSNSGRSILHDDPRHRSIIHESPREPGTDNSGSRSFDLGIPRQSSWTPRAPIRDVSRWISHAKPSTIEGRETSEKATIDNDSLTIGDEGEEPPTRDLSQRSVEASVLKPTPVGFLHLESVDSLGNSKKIVKKRFLTGYSVFSVSLNRRLSKLERLNKLSVARRSKDRRGDGKERRGRSVGYLQGRDSWLPFGDGDRRSDRFERKSSRESIDTRLELELDGIAWKQSPTTRHDDPRDKGASIRRKRNSLFAFDSSNVTFPDEETTRSLSENATNNRESGNDRAKESSADWINETILAGNENHSNATSSVRVLDPNVSKTSVLSTYENNSNGSKFEFESRAGDDIEPNKSANRINYHAVINSRSNAPRDLNDESATTTDTSNDLIDASWAGIDEGREESAMKGRGNEEEEEERSALTSVTKKESGSVLANSRRDSAAARKNATYLRRSDMNSLADGAGSFVPADESSALSRHRGRNANDSFRNSSTTGHGGEGGRIAENFHVNSPVAGRSSVNNEEQAGSRVSPTVPPNVSKNAVLEDEVAATRSGRDDESLDESSEINDEAMPVRDSRGPSTIDGVEARRSDRGTLNGTSRIDLEEANSVDSLNRNVGEIKANESGSSLEKIERPSSNDSLSVEARLVVESSKKTMVNLEDRLTNDPPATHATTSSSIDDRDSKERKSRSSKASTPKIEENTPSKDETRRNLRNEVSIDSTTPKTNDDIILLEASRVGSNGSFQFLSKGPAILSTAMVPTTKQPNDLLATSDATLSSIEGDQLQTVSTIPSINDEDQLLGFDAVIVVTSSEPVDDDGELYTTVSNVSLRGTENSSREMEQPDQWPVKHSAVVEGDLVLGGLMMVHEREDTITCGPVMSQGGIQALEAMLFTLDKLNEDEGIVPGVKIGAHILDDCDKDTYGLEMAVDFIKGTCTHNVYVYRYVVYRFAGVMAGD